MDHCASTSALFIFAFFLSRMNLSGYIKFAVLFFQPFFTSSFPLSDLSSGPFRFLKQKRRTDWWTGVVPTLPCSQKCLRKQRRLFDQVRLCFSLTRRDFGIRFQISSPPKASDSPQEKWKKGVVGSLRPALFSAAYPGEGRESCE